MTLLSCRCSLCRAAAVCALLYVCLWAHAQSPYISKVFAYRPAPGQFVNLLPEYETGDTEESIRLKAEQVLTSPDSGMVSLGGWGGYVVFGFDHPVVNRRGEYDFRVLGNAFYADETDLSKGGSSEPGVVWVSRDDNGNGIPDDKWYELAGSEYQQSTTNYQLTYYRTAADHVRTPKLAEDLIDTTYILWRDVNGSRGYIMQNKHHLQNYYPEWIKADRLTFSGTLLPPNGVAYYEGGKTKYIMQIYDYGYADNHPNATDGSKMNIDWAVDSKGTPVYLDKIHFIKVQTGVNQQRGWTGEASTEVSCAVDLHPNAIPTDLHTLTDTPYPTKILRNGHVRILRNGKEYDILGNQIQNNIQQ